MPYADPEKRRAFLVAWKAAHPDAEKRWRAANQDRIRAANLRRYQADPSRKRAASHARRARAPMLAETLRAVRHECDGACSYCFRPADGVDHVVPLARGGTNGPENLALACLACNVRKGTKTPLEFLGGLPRLG